MSRVRKCARGRWIAEDGNCQWMRATTSRSPQGRVDITAVQFVARGSPTLAVRELVSLRDWLDARIAEIEAAKKPRKARKKPG